MPKTAEQHSTSGAEKIVQGKHSALKSEETREQTVESPEIGDIFAARDQANADACDSYEEFFVTQRFRNAPENFGPPPPSEFTLTKPAPASDLTLTKPAPAPDLTLTKPAPAPEPTPEHQDEVPVTPIAPMQSKPVQPSPVALPAPAVVKPSVASGADSFDWRVGQIVDDRYEVKKVVGRGGMGIVYQVYHREWDLYLAVKMPLPQLVANKAMKARFIQEAQTWVNLGLYPNIVQCWYVREFGGLPRLFMDYLEGGSLKDWMRGGKIYPDDWAQILDLTIQACDGLGYAHEHGVKVHRDVKPANMLMTKDGELRVTDFGIAKRAGNPDEEEGQVITVAAEGKEHTMTVTGLDLGTPEYGAPEQWGEAKYADARADVYALGGVLFELCCGRRAFDDGKHQEQPYALIGRHLFSPPPDPREMNPHVPAVLAELILKCLAKDPEQRPASMPILREKLVETFVATQGKPYWKDVPQAAELRSSLLNNQAVSLLDLGQTQEAFTLFEQALKLDPHHAESVYNKALLEWRQEKIADDEVVRRLKEAQQASRRAGLYLGFIHLERAAANDAEHEFNEAFQSPEVANESSSWRALGDAQIAQEKYSEAEQSYQKALDLLPHDAVLNQRKTLAAQRTRHLDENILFPYPHCLLNLVGYNERPDMIAVTPDARFAILGNSEEVKFWDLARGIYSWSFTWVEEKRGFWNFKGYAGTSATIVLTPDGRYVLMGGSYDSRIWLWELATRKTLRAFSGHDGDITALAVTPDGALMVSSSQDRTLRLWDISTGSCVRVFEGQHELIASLAITPDGRSVISGSRDMLRLWDISTGKYIRNFRGHNDEVTALCITKDGQHLISGSHDKTVRIWKLSSGRCLRTLAGHTANITSVATTPDGRLVVSASLGKMIRVWDLATGECLRILKGHESGVTAIAITPDGEFVLSGSRDRTMRLWRLATGKCFRVYQEHTHWIEAIALTPDGQQVICGNHERLWLKNLSSETNLAEFTKAHETDWLPSTATHTPSGKTEATRSFRLLPPGETFWTIVGRDPQKTAVVATPDGHFGLSGGADETFWLRDVRTDTCLSVFRGQRGFQIFKKDRTSIPCIAITADECLAVSGWFDTSVRLWDLKTGKCLRVFEGHQQNVVAVAITLDGRFALSGSTDTTVRLWDVKAGNCLHTLRGHKESVLSVAMTSDGRFAVSGSSDRTLRLWDLTTGKCLRTFEDHTDSVIATAITPDGQFAISASLDRVVRLWRMDAAVPRQPAALQVSRHLGHSELEQLRKRFQRYLSRAQAAQQAGKTATAYTFLSLARSIPGYERDPEALALNAALSEHLRKKSLRHGRLFGLLEGHEATVTALFTTQDGHLALSGSQDRTLRLWGLTTKKVLRTFRGHSDYVTCAAITPDRHLVLSGSWDRTVRLWALATGESLKVFHEHEDYVKAVAISPDGRFALSGSSDKTLRLWSLITEKYHKIFEGVRIPLEDAYRSAELTSNHSLRIFRDHAEGVEAVAFLPSGSLAISGSRDKTLRLWHLMSGRCVRTFSGHQDFVTCVVISPDGRYVLSGSRDKTIRLWHLASGTCLRIFRGHDAPITAIALTSDARFLLSGSWDKSLRLWRLVTGECLRTFERHEEIVEAVAMTPDGHFALSGGRDKAIRIWEFDWELGPEKEVPDHPEDRELKDVKAAIQKQIP